MKRKVLVIAMLLVIAMPFAKADEGMWLPLLINRLNHTDMQKMGLNLTAEEIYSVNHSSLKDAIVIFGGGCTGEIISPEGLLLTNHHCGFSYINDHSTVEHNYLDDGFWAMNRSEELKNEDLTVKFLVRMEDFTERILAELNDDMSEDERDVKIKEISKIILEEEIGDDDYIGDVKSFFNGNEFYLFIYQVYKDVRLVGAPPSSIGKYGADTDNWMWPRHTGDFSMFRVYTDADGNPAEYSPNNIPMKSKYSLPINMGGVDEGDFAMILGYPGSTDRYLTSYGINTAINITNPAIVNIRTIKLETMKKYMDKDEEVRIQYATKYTRIANYWKYFIGQTKGLKDLDVYQKKLKIENEFIEWVDQSTKRKKKYGEVMENFENYYKNKDESEKAITYYNEAGMGSGIIEFGRNFSSYIRYFSDYVGDQDMEIRYKTYYNDLTKEHFKNYNIELDKDLFAETMKMIMVNLEEDEIPESILKANKKYKGNFNLWADDVFENSIFGNKEKAYEFITNPKEKTYLKDPISMIYDELSSKYFEKITLRENYKSSYKEANRLFVEALRLMSPNKTFYPDANSTMRLSYGQVLSYDPQDGAHFNYFTTMKGIMEKENPTLAEFTIPDKLKELYNNKDFGPYGDGDIMKVCFITNNDITGGNSGSPVIDGNGNLIGLAFDGNWEAMSGDIFFEPAIQRTISVDIRYVLFIVDKYAGATHLIDEMELVYPDLKNELIPDDIYEEETAVEIN